MSEDGCPFGCFFFIRRLSCTTGQPTISWFAVPFEEDDRNHKIWFLDHSYLEAMFNMFRKVNGGSLLSVPGVLL